jgi:hypothetical protein
LNVIETSFPSYPGLSIRYLPSKIFSSSSLTYLCINVETLNDCLYLLDGRLKQLTTFIVRIYSMDTNPSIVHNIVSLFGFRVFRVMKCQLRVGHNQTVYKL